MSNAPHRTSPFSRRCGGEQVLAPALAGGITLRALAERAVFRLEVGDRTALEAACRRVFGWPPPAINRSGGTAELRCLGVAPAAWLFTGPDDGNRRLWQSCRDLADEADGALVDLSHGYCVLSLEGGAARGLLQRLCPADVHFAAFSAGYCFSSNLEGHRVLIDVSDERPALELFVERSYSLSFWECLVDAAEAYAEAGP